MKVHRNKIVTIKGFNRERWPENGEGGRMSGKRYARPLVCWRCREIDELSWVAEEELSYISRHEGTYYSKVAPRRVARWSLEFIRRLPRRSLLEFTDQMAEEASEYRWRWLPRRSHYILRHGLLGRILQEVVKRDCREESRDPSHDCREGIR